MIDLEKLCKEIEWDDRFWNPTTLITKKDSNGNAVGVFVCCSNRTGGKTYGIGQILMLHAMKYDGKFGLICRVQGDLGTIAEGVLGQVLEDKYPEWKISEKVSKTKTFSEIYMTKKGEDGEKKKVGYVFVLNSAFSLKDYSSFFTDCDVMFRDEFQAERYLSEEVLKFQVLHGSVARGGETGVRYVPAIMCSNSLNPNNPYFDTWRVNTRIHDGVKFLRNPGLVIEFYENKYAQEQQEKDPFNVAFSMSDEIKATTSNEWLDNPWNCVMKPGKHWGKSLYICTFINGKKSYGVRWYDDVGFYYVSRSIDKQCPSVYSLKLDDLESVPVVRTGQIFVRLKRYYSLGKVRFSDIGVKNDILTIL